MAETLRKAIAKSGRTVGAIAVDAKIPQPVLHRFYKGERGLNLDTAEKLARYFNLELRPARS
jgi:plasmid maintenance system antidote protein VapI